jgi:hypothetical protein
MNRIVQIGRIAFTADTKDPYFFENPLCKYTDPEIFFPETSNLNSARSAIKICQQCDHEIDCAAYAIVRPSIIGIWGATTYTQRRKIRKKLNINEDYDDNTTNNDSITEYL